MVETLKFHGVGVTFVSQGIDTLDKTARQLVTLNGMMDEQFLVGVADKVHRGQEGRVLKGLNPGGKLYGYTNVPILSSTRPGKYGRPAVDGVDQEINAEQASVVVRIFQMYASHKGLAMISKFLNAERVPSGTLGRGAGSDCPREKECGHCAAGRNEPYHRQSELSVQRVVDMCGVQI